MLRALCFVLRAHALCLSGFLVTARQARSMRTKHAQGADGQPQQAGAPDHENQVFVPTTLVQKNLLNKLYAYTF
jgi:hypothetical protein